MNSPEPYGLREPVIVHGLSVRTKCPFLRVQGMRAAASPEARGLLRVLLIRLDEVPFATGRGARQVTETALHQDLARVAAL